MKSDISLSQSIIEIEYARNSQGESTPKPNSYLYKNGSLPDIN